MTLQDSASSAGRNHARTTRRTVLQTGAAAVVLVSAGPAAALPRTPYDNYKAMTYAKATCGKQSNACGVFLSGDNKSDCAHFVAHCLNAGGIRIADTDGTNLCPQGLAVRNTTLVASLKALAVQFANVKEIGLSDAIVGDIGFLDIARPTHAFMICEPFDLRSPTNAPKVYAHSSSRCAERLDTEWRHWFTTTFRLEDG